MTEIKAESNSEGYILLGEADLITMLDGSAEVLLTIFNQFGEDSKPYLITESFFECVKAEYALLTAVHEYYELCKEHRTNFSAEAVQTILDLNKVRSAIQKQLDKLGLN